MKNLKRWAVAIGVIASLAVGTYAVGHSGGTDAYGCHVDHKDGLRHCH